MKSEYEGLIEAALDIQGCMDKLNRAEGNYASPAWKMLYHAQKHVSTLAEEVLRQGVRA